MVVTPGREINSFSMTIPVSVRVDAIAERFHIDCHMFCILLGQDPKAVSDSALECFGRGNNLLWPTGAPSLIIRSMPLATSWASPRVV